MNTLFKNVTVNGKTTSIYIKDRILERHLNADDSFETIDCTGCIAIPSFTDLHVHLRDPGFRHKETVETGTLAARNGGFNSVFAMPNTKPVCDNSETVKYILSQKKYTDVYPVAAITKGLNGSELTDFEKLRISGVAALSDDGFPVEDTDLFTKALIEAKRVDLPVFAHCEKKSLVKDRLNIPAEAESEAVKREISAAIKAKTPLHICHVSTKKSLEIIREAKNAGIEITAETCPHYFTLTKNSVKEKGSYAMMNPPLGEASDLEAVKNAIADGTIDVISTDHAPHSTSEKSVELRKAPFGITGLETSFALSYTNLVKPGIITFDRLLDMMCVKPRLIGRISNIPFLEDGFEPSFIIVDLNSEYAFDKSKSFSKSDNTPFDRYMMTGEIKYNILRGDVFQCQQMHL